MKRHHCSTKARRLVTGHGLLGVILWGLLSGGVAAETAPKSRLKVPPPGEIESAAARIREVFKSEFARNEPSDMDALAERLVSEAKGLGGDYVAQYAMLQEASNLAIRAGDPVIMMLAVEQMAASFDVDALALREKSLLAVGRNLRDHDQAKAFLRASLPLVEARVKADEFDRAMPLLRMSQQVAQDSGDMPVARQSLDRIQECQRLQAEFTKVKPALAKLQADPIDPQANTLAGRYFCMVREDWIKGLDYLTKCDDSRLRSASDLDLATKRLNPGGDDISRLHRANEQVRAGDAWVEVAPRQAVSNRPAVLRRALHWYQLAEPALTSLARTAAKRKIEATRQALVGPGRPVFLLDLPAEYAAQVQRFHDKYYLLVPDRMKFADAEDWARKRGGHLVCIADKSEMDFVVSLVAEIRSEAWTGGNSSEAHKGTWGWVDGSPWRFTNWDKNQPDNWHNEEYCTAVRPTGRWNDLSGNQGLPFIVQWRAK